MGFSDAGLCLSDQNNLCETELGFLRVPSLGFSDRSVQEFRPNQDLETKVQEITNLSRKEEVKVKKDEEDLCKTPTRLDQILPKIPNICPPAPRKPKGVPSRSLKVRDSYRSRRMIILNVSREIDCMFHSASLVYKTGWSSCNASRKPYAEWRRSKSPSFCSCCCKYASGN